MSVIFQSASVPGFAHRRDVRVFSIGMWAVLLWHVSQVFLPASLKFAGTGASQVVTLGMAWAPVLFAISLLGVALALPSSTRGQRALLRAGAATVAIVGALEALGFSRYWVSLYGALLLAALPVVLAAIVSRSTTGWGTPGRGWLYAVAAAHVVSAAVDFGWAFAGHNAPFGPALMYASYACHLAAAFVFGLFVHRARLAVAQAPDAWTSDAPAGAQ